MRPPEAWTTTAVWSLIWSQTPVAGPVSGWAGLREGLGPEFAAFEIEDLNPKRFVRKHLSGDLNADQRAQQQPARQTAVNGTPLTPGECPPFDPDAT